MPIPVIKDEVPAVLINEDIAERLNGRTCSFYSKVQAHMTIMLNMAAPLTRITYLPLPLVTVVAFGKTAFSALFRPIKVTSLPILYPPINRNDLCTEGIMS